MKTWFSRFFSTSATSTTTQPEDIQKGLNDFVSFLSMQISEPQKAKGLVEETTKFRNLTIDKQIEECPRFYLAFEQYLTEIDKKVSYTTQKLRDNIKTRFPFLSTLEGFSVILKPSREQSIYLCKQLLELTLDSILEVLGAAQDDWFKKLKLSVQRIPNNPNLEQLPFVYNQTITSSEDWIHFFKITNQKVLDNIENKVGVVLSKRLFERSYKKVANTYQALDTFPSVVAILPDRLLDTEKIDILSKHQLVKILLEKADYLENLNHSLSEKNQKLEEAQFALSTSKNETESAFRQLSAVLNTVNEGIITANSNSKIVMMNQQIQAIFGYTNAELIGRDLTTIMPESYRPHHKAGMKRHLQTNSSVVLNTTVQLEGLHKNGTVFPIEINIAKTEVDGKVLFTAAIKDITQRLAMEKALIQSKEELEERVEERTTELNIAQQELKSMILELERSNTELEQFAYITSHDLQEPLRMVTSYLQLIQRLYKNKLDETGLGYMNFAIDGAKRMKQLIRDLLQYSRVGRGTLSFKPIKIETLQLLMNNTFRARLEETKGQISFTGITEIVADRTLMIQLLQNLIGNALKFKKETEPPQITIYVTETEQYWQLEIKDNGIGIEERFQEKIFAVFHRLNHDDAYEGTGIGLAICKKIADQHKGKIWVESKFGVGSTFYISISKHL